MAQPRFFVLSMVFMYNTKCSYNKKSGLFEFQELQWQIPIQALTQVKMIEVPGKKIEIRLLTDLKMQSEILEKYNQKKVTKNERIVEFNASRKTTAREFLWHLKRIHHWWNCRGKGNQNPPLDIQFK
mmetsp:Transcript_1052/g.1939  ORF Transcript_1052/g.1939 Transcript_1052/m.1939 type:complete len:127 (-) Transcript_1052:119-499(-)